MAGTVDFGSIHWTGAIVAIPRGTYLYVINVFAVVGNPIEPAATAIALAKEQASRLATLPG